MEILRQIVDKVIEGNVDEIESLTREAVEQKIDLNKIIYEGFMPGLDVVGEKYTAGEYFLPEMLVSGMGVKAGMEILKPLMTKSSVKSEWTIVIGTVEGDIHDIGKNLVGVMMEAAGFKVIDVGVDVPAEKFINAAKENKANIIGISALLSSTRANMPRIIRAIRNSELNHRVKVMVGGAAVTQDLADSMGADGYASNGGLAAKKAKELLGVD